MILNERDRLRVQAQLVADIESLDALSASINGLLRKIVDTMAKNRDRMAERDWWVYGLRLVQNLNKVEAMNAQKRDILAQIQKLISVPTGT